MNKIYDQFNIQQKASYHLIQNDLRFIYTVFQNAPSNNFFLAFMPYLGTIIDGAEDWVKAYNNSQKSKINIPTFDSEEELYYGKMRSAIKMFEQPMKICMKNCECYMRIVKNTLLVNARK